MDKKEMMIKNILFLILLLMIVLNSTKYNFRLDLTKNKVYTISKETKNVLSSLKEKVFISYYFSDGLEKIDIKNRFIDDFLYEYAGVSKNIIYDRVVLNNSNIKQINPDSLGLMFKIHNGSSQISETLKILYSGIVIKYLDKVFTIPFILTDKSLEYRITSSIKSIITKPKVLGLVIGTKENFENYQYMYNIFQNKIQQLNPQLPIPLGVDVLYVVGISNLNKEALYNIDQYIMNGGNVMITADKFNINKGSNHFSIDEINNSEAFNMLSYYGVRIESSILLDESSLAIVNPANMQQRVLYPFWINILSKNISDKKLLGHIEGLNLFWASPIDYDQNSKNIKPIIKTTEKSWLIQAESHGYKYIDPVNKIFYEAYKENTKSYTVGVKIQGELKSYFNDKVTSYKKITSTKNANVLIISNAMFLEAGLVNYGQKETNYNFLEVIFEYLSQDSELLLIKSKDNSFNQFNKIDTVEEKSRVIFWIGVINIFVIPLILTIFYLFFSIKNSMLKSKVKK